MNTILPWLLKTKYQHPKASQQGFTLIELLVGLLVAVLVMIPLFSLAINLIDTDRREQAKSATEQEIQAAADFIARDLQQAIYVYDSVALTRNLNPSDPSNSGIRDQIPPISGGVSNCNNPNTCIPVLAFWTRRVAENSSPIRGAGNNACRPGLAQATLDANCDDSFVYALVVYYLILAKDNPNGPAPTNSVWSNTARIGRFEVSDGVKNSNDELIPAGESRKPRDPGYAPFDLSLDGEDIRSKMNRWDGALNEQGTGAEAYGTNSLQILIDHIDATTVTVNNQVPAINCPTPDNGAGAESQSGWLQSPYYGSYSPAPNPAPTTAPTQFHTYSFYACVNSEQRIAKIYLRGNALSRLRGENVNTFFDANNLGLFPTVSAEVQLEGRLSQ